MHPNESELRAYIDQENLESGTARHLEQCVECRNAIANLRKRSERVTARLDLLNSNEPAPPASEAMRQLRDKDAKTRRRFYFRPAWAAIAVLAVCGAAFSLGSVRLWAQEFLLLFRAQQISVLPIDPANVERLQRDFFGPQNRPDIERLFSDNVHVVEYGKPQDAFTVSDAAAKAGFGLRLPTVLPAPAKFHVQPAKDISFDIDLKRIQSILEEAGRNDIQLSPELDGKTVSANISPVAAAFFGKCPDWTDKNTRHSYQEFAECKVLAQMQAPVIAAPPQLDAKELGQAMLQLLGTPKDQAKAISENINWATTLVLPVPADERMKYADVVVDGVKGALMTRDDRHAFNLIWLRDGVLYSLLGHGTAEDAAAIANSMN
jgi:hypothetical protein